MNVNGKLKEAKFEMWGVEGVNAEIKFEMEDTNKIDVKWSGNISFCSDAQINYDYFTVVTTRISFDELCEDIAQNMAGILTAMRTLFGPSTVVVRTTDIKVYEQDDLLATFEWLNGSIRIGGHYITRPINRYSY